MLGESGLWGTRVCDALHSDSRVARGIEMKVLFLSVHRWFGSRVPLRTHPGKESGTPIGRLASAPGKVLGESVRDWVQTKKARRLHGRIGLPCR